MTDWLRRAGRGLFPDGRTLLWSVAEGRRGRRWRSSTIDPDGRLVLALLYEESAEGRFTRLELVNATGMLTLHPESDGARVDGNVVGVAGVRPISLPWAPDFVLIVPDSPIPEILTRRAIPTGRKVSAALVIAGDLSIRSDPSLAGQGTGPAADDRGVPELTSPSEWALEDDAAP